MLTVSFDITISSSLKDGCWPCPSYCAAKSTAVWNWIALSTHSPSAVTTPKNVSVWLKRLAELFPGHLRHLLLLVGYWTVRLLYLTILGSQRLMRSCTNRAYRVLSMLIASAIVLRSMPCSVAR